ncbi:hypothetical protein AGRO_3925 [Agrobacterium sp. ATCC 31749]|nr:hypothetical protein AGRO_3925 [Agrobacterium sp. ATCC 31749]
MRHRRETLDHTEPPRHKARYENNDLHLLLNNFCWFATGQIVFVFPQGPTDKRSGQDN